MSKKWRIIVAAAAAVGTLLGYAYYAESSENRAEKEKIQIAVSHANEMLTEFEDAPERKERLDLIHETRDGFVKAADKRESPEFEAWHKSYDSMRTWFYEDYTEEYKKNEVTDLNQYGHEKLPELQQNVQNLNDLKTKISEETESHRTISEDQKTDLNRKIDQMIKNIDQRIAELTL